MRGWLEVSSVAQLCDVLRSLLKVARIHDERHESGAGQEWSRRSALAQWIYGRRAEDPTGFPSVMMPLTQRSLRFYVFLFGVLGVCLLSVADISFLAAHMR